jgi:uncharacterized protein YidB (DUF937 family)
MDTGKLSLLLDDPEVRVIVYGLAHFYPAQPTESGPERLHAVLQRMVDTADPVQAESWLSDQTVNRGLTVDQIHTAFGDDVIRDLANYVDSQPDEIAWQLTSVLPDLVDAFSSGGAIADAADVRTSLFGAIDAADRSAGPFGYHVD